MMDSPSDVSRTELISSRERGAEGRGQRWHKSAKNDWSSVSVARAHLASYTRVSSDPAAVECRRVMWCASAVCEVKDARRGGQRSREEWGQVQPQQLPAHQCRLLAAALKPNSLSRTRSGASCLISTLTDKSRPDAPKNISTKFHSIAHSSKELVFLFTRTIVELQSNAFENAIVHSANA